MKFQGFTSSQGYTLFEALIIVAVLGILCAIAAPSWLRFLTKLRLNAAQSQALAVMREAQAGAKRQKIVWEASFREQDGRLQWSVHPEHLPEANWKWNNLIGEDANKIAIDQSYTKLRIRNGVYYLQFQHKGSLDGVLNGRITFISRQAQNSPNSLRRCVFASTILGALRTDENNGCKRE